MKLTTSNPYFISTDYTNENYMHYQDCSNYATTNTSDFSINPYKYSNSTDSWTYKGKPIKSMSWEEFLELEKYYTDSPTPWKGYSVGFKEIIERCPDKVYEFIFYDNTHIKTICQEGDTFDLEYAFYLALAKYLYSKEYTFEGIINKSYEIQTEKKYIKIVKEGMKKFKADQKVKAKEEAYQEKIEAIKQNHHRKNERRKAAKRAKENEALKEIIKDAINESK